MRPKGIDYYFDHWCFAKDKRLPVSCDRKQLSLSDGDTKRGESLFFVFAVVQRERRPKLAFDL